MATENFSSTQRRNFSDRSSRSLSKIRILLIEPETLTRMGLKALFSNSGRYEVTAEATDVDQALEIQRRNHLDIIVTNAELPGKSALELLYELKRLNRLLPTLILCSSCTPTFVKQAIFAGAKSIVLKKDSFEIVERAISVIITNENYFSPEIQPMANSLELQIRREVISEATDPLSPLSSREREIFHLLASGMQNSSIAKQLFISPRTVETHRARVVRKLGLHSNAELIRYAIKNGLSSL